MLSLEALGTIGCSSESFIDLLKSLSFNDKLQKHILSKLINITIRCTYYYTYFRKVLHHLEQNGRAAISI